MTRERFVVPAQIAVVCAGLMGLAAGGLIPLIVGTALLQLFLVLGFLALVDAPAALGVFVLGVGAAVAADVTVHVQKGHVGGLAGVAALSLVAGMLLQLVRKQRDRVTESLADALVAVVLVCSAACLPAALQHPSGSPLVRAGLLAAGGAVILSRVATLLGLVAAFLAVPEAGSHLSTAHALSVGVAAAATALTAALLVERSRGDVSYDERRLVALRPVATLLPFAVVAPVLLVATRLLEQA